MRMLMVLPGLAGSGGLLLQRAMNTGSLLRQGSCQLLNPIGIRFDHLFLIPAHNLPAGPLINTLLIPLHYFIKSCWKCMSLVKIFPRNSRELRCFGIATLLRFNRLDTWNSVLRKYLPVDIGWVSQASPVQSKN